MTSVNRCARGQQLLREDERSLPFSAVRRGLSAVLSVQVPNPRWGGSSDASNRLCNEEIAVKVKAVVRSGLEAAVEQDPGAWAAIASHCRWW